MKPSSLSTGMMTETKGCVASAVKGRSGGVGRVSASGTSLQRDYASAEGAWLCAYVVGSLTIDS